MAFGMRAKYAVHVIGNSHANELWLVEGFATGLSVAEALRLLRIPPPWLYVSPMAISSLWRIECAATGLFCRQRFERSGRSGGAQGRVAVCNGGSSARNQETWTRMICIRRPGLWRLLS